MKAFIFDLDGTLLDTLEDIGQACNAVLAAHGYPTHPLAAYRRMVGNGFGRLVRSALPPAALQALTPEALTPLVDEARAWYGRHMREHTHPYAGMPEALTELARRGLTLAVLSNKPDDFTRTLINHYFPQIPFAEVRGGRSDTPLKPDPAGPRAICRVGSGGRAVLLRGRQRRGHAHGAQCGYGFRRCGLGLSRP